MDKKINRYPFKNCNNIIEILDGDILNSNLKNFSGGFCEKDCKKFEDEILNIRQDLYMQIETILKGICQGSIYLFTSENKIQLFTKDGRLININKNTLTISKRYIVKKEFINILSITKIKKGEFIAICSNNELITFSDK